MPSSKGRRLATAVGFVSGVITCLDAVHDAKTSWPPNAVWAMLRRPQKVELCAGLALMIITLILSIVPHKQ